MKTTRLDLAAERSFWKQAKSWESTDKGDCDRSLLGTLERKMEKEKL